MRILFLIIFLLLNSALFATDPVTKIAKANKAKEEAEKAFRAGEYQKAIEHYSYLLDSLNYDNDAAVLNRAHSYFNLKDTLNAYEAYRTASMSANKEIKSKAFNQLGNLSEQQKQNKEALEFYKEALKANPANSEARYNYELLKKKLEEQEKNKDQQQNQDQQNQDQNKEDQQNKDQQNKQDQNKNQEDQNSEDQQNKEDQEKSQEGDESKEQQDKKNADQQDKSEEQKDGEQQDQKSQEDQQSADEQKQQEQEAKKEGEQEQMKPSTKEKLEAMNVSEEKAKMILEALRNKEAQYLQQTRKKATKRQDSGKPDW
jgi:tetratricopeptide (TPR) repeat protein